MRFANLNNLLQSTNFLFISSIYFSQKKVQLIKGHVIKYLGEYKESYQQSGKKW